VTSRRPVTGPSEFEHASELVEMPGRWARSRSPSGRTPGPPRSPDLTSDRLFLARKLETADFAVTQFLFGVDEVAFVSSDDLDRLGVSKPVLPHHAGDERLEHLAHGVDGVRACRPRWLHGSKRLRARRESGRAASRGSAGRHSAVRRTARRRVRPACTSIR